MTEPWIFSWSELDAWRQCPHKWELAWRERWRQPEDRTAPALQRGTAWHAVMADFWTQRLNGIAWKHAGKRTRKKLLVSTDGTQTEQQQLLDWMFEGYLEHWEGDEMWEPVAVESLHQVPIARDFVFNLRVDLIFLQRKQNRLWLVDYKTAKNLPRSEDYQFHEQFALYVYMLRRIGTPIWGVLYDGARTYRYTSPNKEQRLEDRFHRVPIHYADEELRVLTRDAIADMRQARAMYERHSAKGRDLPRHLDPERCHWRCSFTEPCLAGTRNGREREREFLRDLGFQPDSPFAERGEA